MKNIWMCTYCCIIYHLPKDMLKIRCKLQYVLISIKNVLYCVSYGRGQQRGDCRFAF